MAEAESSKEGKDRPSVIRETDEAALLQARNLMRSARHAALAVVDLETGFPSVSRTLVITDHDGTPVILVSALSGHTRPLAEDGRASLLFGEPGKGDPLAHPRITVQCRAMRIVRDSTERERVRQRFLSRHPKAQLYIDFPDFSFFRLVPVGASLNGGFGKAYQLSGDDLTIRSDASETLAEMEAGAIAHMNEDHADAVALYAQMIAGEKPGAWKMVTLDAEGFEIGAGDRLVRLAFEPPLAKADDLRPALVKLAKSAREAKPLDTNQSGTN